MYNMAEDSTKSFRVMQKGWKTSLGFHFSRVQFKKNKQQTLQGMLYISCKA